MTEFETMRAERDALIRKNNDANGSIEYFRRREQELCDERRRSQDKLEKYQNDAERREIRRFLFGVTVYVLCAFAAGGRFYHTSCADEGNMARSVCSTVKGVLWPVTLGAEIAVNLMDPDR